MAEGAGGPEIRQLHPWQESEATTAYWVRQLSEPSELIFDPLLVSGLGSRFPLLFYFSVGGAHGL